jgi:hypothetical protein
MSQCAPKKTVECNGFLALKKQKNGRVSENICSVFWGFESVALVKTERDAGFYRAQGARDEGFRGRGGWAPVGGLRGAL